MLCALGTILSCRCSFFTTHISSSPSSIIDRIRFTFFSARTGFIMLRPGLATELVATLKEIVRSHR